MTNTLSVYESLYGREIETLNLSIYPRSFSYAHSLAYSFFNSNYDYFWTLVPGYYDKEIRKHILKLKASNSTDMIGDNYYEQIQYFNSCRFKAWSGSYACEERVSRAVEQYNRDVEARLSINEINNIKYVCNKNHYIRERQNIQDRSRRNKKMIYKHNYYDKCK